MLVTAIAILTVIALYPSIEIGGVDGAFSVIVCAQTVVLIMLYMQFIKKVSKLS